MKTTTRLVLATVALLSLGSGTASADFLLSVTGKFRTSHTESTRFDGLNTYDDDLPPILALDRLQGGTFSASFLYPPTITYPSGDNATYSFDPPYGMSYTLYDAEGSVVHIGYSSSSAFALIFNDVSFSSGQPTRLIDQASWFAFVNQATGLQLPTTYYSPDHGLYSLQNSLIFSGVVSGANDYLTNLAVPTDASTLLAFPNKSFSTGFEWDDGDVFGDTPYAYISTNVSYDITGVQVTVVPEPSSLLLSFGGTVAFVAFRAVSRRRGRIRRAGSPWVVAHPGIPQIQTCGFPASGSSRCGACPQSVPTP